MRTEGLRTAVVSGLAMFAMSRGLSMLEVLEAAELQPSDLADAEGRIPYDCVLRIWRLLDERLPNVAHGLELAMLTPPSVWGVLNQATAFAPTVADAAQMYVRYTSLISTGSSTQVVELEDGMGIQTILPDSAMSIGHVADYAMATALRHMFAGEARRHVVRCELGHSPRAPRSRYDEILAVPVVFEQPVAAMVVVSREGWRAPRPQADPALLANLNAYMDAALAATPVDSDVELRSLYRAIAACAARGEFSVSETARELGMSVRSLQRHAQAHEAQVGHLIDRARAANAQRLLAEPALSVAEVAFMLGYSEERAFTRAFKRWTGQTPAQFRSSRRPELL